MGGWREGWVVRGGVEGIKGGQRTDDVEREKPLHEGVALGVGRVGVAVRPQRVGEGGDLEGRAQGREGGGRDALVVVEDGDFEGRHCEFCFSDYLRVC